MSITQGEKSKNGSVLVVGGGIAGMQAALDLANSGYYVHLAEKSSAIGGTMAQIDKTFPTNDCAMWIISPKLVEVGRHINIELHTQTELKEIHGEPGNLTVALEKQPRYIDMAKCTGCGDCTTACPVSLKDEFNLGLAERKAIYRQYPQAIPSAFAIQKLDRAPCTRTCPADINVQGYVQLVKVGKYDEAVQLIMERAPLPGILGRICPHPCEDKCRRLEIDEPIAISALKRFAADQVDLEALPTQIAAPRSEKIAIIGSGPAGLACAYHLALRGYTPTIYEALSQPGGMLRVGIPEYRLPRVVVDKEIANIMRLGIELKTKMALGLDFSLDDLFAEGYQAIFLGLGCHVGKKLGIEGEDALGVMQGVEFLRRQNLGQPLKVGKRVAVIGGGNVALDVASAARRLGAQVSIVYRRTREEMPAHAWEIDQGLCEGIRILYQLAPVKINIENGRVAGIVCQQVHLGEPDQSGRRRPIPIAGAEFELPVDMVIPAIGQETALKALDGSGVKISRDGTIEVDEISYQTSRVGVFAAGDAHTGPWIAVEAMGGGKEAAESIDRYLKGEDMKAGRVLGIEARERWREIPRDEEGRPREIMPTLPPEISSICFAEIAQGYTEEQAISEASRCLNCGICSECMECVRVCQAKAVDHGQQPQNVQLEVGSVVLAPGFKTVDAHLLDTYGYGNFPNVVTNLEFERLLSAGGPTAGHVQRASDGREPAKIAWIQCVGSRSVTPHAKEYCSSYCCMAALKQAIIAKEHAGPDLETSIFFIDMRTSRKEYEKYLERAKDLGVRLIRCRPHSIDEMRDSHDLQISYVTEAGEIKQEVFDQVVLSMAMETTTQTRQLAADLGIRMDEYDFIDSSCFTPVTTSQPGIYACGVALGPKDIPETVLDASAAATAATRSLAAARGTRIKKKVYPPERQVAAEEPRVGVFVCNCGINIGGFVDVPAIAENARQIPGVSYVQENLFTCSQDAQEQMAEKIKELNLNRVVVAACSPSTHQPIFQEMMRNAGLNKYLFEMANIRNQCSWVHQADPSHATGKCQDLVHMAVAKAALLDPLEYLQVDVEKRALVIGGGVAGMNAALSLADQGYEVHLVERMDHLGGNARRLLETWKGETIQPYLEALVAEVTQHPRITVHYWSIVEDVVGNVGNFRSRLSSGQEIQHGIVVIAIGAEPLRPTGMYLYRQHPNVLLTLDFDRELARQSQRISDAKAIAFIQCVGSRIPERPYCSRICCKHSVENAIRMKETYPEVDVAIIYRDMRTDGKLEKLYKKARDLGVLFIRYTLEEPPQVGYEGDQILITVMDQVLQRPVRLSVDILTLATAVIPHRNAPLADLYKIHLNAEGFFNEAHAKIRPVDAATEGIFLAGLCHYPKFIHEAIAEGLAAASRANTILSQDYLELDSTISHPVDENCDGCAFCVDACPYQAITLLEYMKDGTVKKTVEVNEVLCKGCGSCMATCPKQGIYVAGFTLEQLGAQIEAALGLR